MQMPIYPHAVVNDKKQNDKSKENRIDEDKQLPADRQLMPSVFERFHHGNLTEKSRASFLGSSGRYEIERNQTRLAEFSQFCFRCTYRSFSAAGRTDAAAVRSLCTTGRFTRCAGDVAGCCVRSSVLPTASCVYRTAIGTLGTAGGLRSCPCHFVSGCCRFRLFSTARRLDGAAVCMLGTTRRPSRCDGVNIASGDEGNGEQNSREYSR